MIEVKNLEKSFGEQKVLNDVSLVCPNGEITGIIGHNGSGKTVLFKCICGLLFEDSGEILIDGKRYKSCLLYTSPSPRDGATSRMPSSA